MPSQFNSDYPAISYSFRFAIKAAINSSVSISNSYTIASTVNLPFKGTVN
jgi:hypothetical protein